MGSTRVSDKEKKKRSSHVTAELKLKILKAIDEGFLTVTTASLEHDLHPSTIRRWFKNRKNIMKCSKQGSKSKHIRSSPLKDINVILKEWFTEMRLRGFPVSGPILKAKALELHYCLNNESKFTASEGWLTKWKNKYGIRQLSIVGEKLSADTTSAEKFKADFLKLIQLENLHPCQIFNADETGLYYKLMPKNTLATKTERNAYGFKDNKERITVMPCCNADGSCKLPLVVIGKYAKPRTLKNMSKNSLPVYYTSQKNAWMSREIFETWFKQEFIPCVTRFLQKRGLPAKAVLLLDNAPSHPLIENLSVDDFKAVFLLSNVTSLIQPMDQGIIANLKQRYRMLLLMSILNSQENNIFVVTKLKSINIKEVIFWIHEAWDGISRDTISKCWSPILSSLVSPTDFEMPQEVMTESVVNILKQVSDYENASIETIQQWLNERDNLSSEEPSLEEIIAKVYNKKE